MALKFRFIPIYRKSAATFLIDLLLLIFVAWVWGVYDYDVDPAPTALWTLLELGALWFILRILLAILPRIRDLLTLALVLWAVIEGIWGIGQLWGWLAPGHALFRTTGSFFNSGPYGGFLATLFPLILHLWIRSHKRGAKIDSYITLIAGGVLILILPATLSRTAWIAAIASSVWVLYHDTSIFTGLRELAQKYPKRASATTALAILLIVGAGIGAIRLKQQSADGRILLWKTTLTAIRQAPINGVGLGGFPAAYGEGQSYRYRSGLMTEHEIAVAGSPEYAFNEYLRIFLEEGAIGGILFLMITLCILWIGRRNDRIGLSGSFLALSIFALASYPYSLWQFCILWIILGALSLSSWTGRSSSYFWLLACIPFLIVVYYAESAKHPYRLAEQEWHLRRLPHVGTPSEGTLNWYQSLYPQLKHNSRFIFDYGMVLNRAKLYATADSALARGMEISCDPMFLNVRGRNAHENGRYEDADTHYHSSIALLPGRVYPYYLLVRLYADSAYYHPRRLREVADSVMLIEPKVHSPAVLQMRREVRSILQKLKTDE